MTAERIAYGAPSMEPPQSIAGGEAGLGDIFGAAMDQMRLVELQGSAFDALNEAMDARNRAIKAATGIDPGNPLNQADVAMSAVGAGMLAPSRDRYDEAMADYYRRLEALASEFPASADVIKASTPIEQDAEALARDADARLSELMGASPGWGKWAAAFGGGMAGGMRDPVTLGSLFLGGGPGAGRTAVGRILSTAAREAAINAGTEAVVQPAVQRWREQAGLPHGFDEAAQNVLAAAALGGVFGTAAGGLHEVVRALRPARAALPAEQRGALDVADQLAALDAERPSDVAPERFDRQVAAADANAQRVETAPVEPDEVSVNRLVNALAPSPDSVSEPIGTRSEASLAELVSGAADPATSLQRPPTPFLTLLRRLGPFDPESAIAAELKAAGITAPSLFRKGGSRGLDNVPHAELPEEIRFAVAEDGNGYASQQALIDGAARELELAPGGRTPGDLADERAFLESQGVDFSRPADEVRAQILEADAARARYELASDEAVAVPEGLSRREHTARLVRDVLRAQPGLPDALVREAVNLALMERMPVLEALSDVMSDAAGVPRERELLGQAYDQVNAEPRGPAGDPLVEISPADIDAVIVERGALKNVSEVDVKSKAGFGLVKIIWKHGEKSAKAPQLQVRRADIVALPQVVRNFEPRINAQGGREWVVESNGRTLLYADKEFPGDNRHLVTIHVLERGDRTLSGRRTSQPVPSRVATAPKATAGELSAAASGAAGRPEANVGASSELRNLVDELGTEPPPVPAERTLDAEGEEGLDLAAERAALEELGFTGDALPVGDQMVSLDELEARIAEAAWLERVVEACKL